MSTRITTPTPRLAAALEAPVIRELATTARAARNLRTAEAIAERNAVIIRAKRTQSTWKIAQATQLSESTVRGIRAN